MRIEVEHAFGLLKGRFRALKEMGPHLNIQDLYKAIEALMILHNMCIDHGDQPDYFWTTMGEGFTEEVDFDNDTDVDVGEQFSSQIPPHETDEWLKIMGKRKRMIIFNDLVPPDVPN